MRSVLVLSTKKPLSVRALDSGASALLLRLEGPSREEARTRTCAFLDAARMCAVRPKVWAQVAPAPGGEIDADLEALAGEALDGVFLEACEGRQHVQQLCIKLAAREAEAGLRAGGLKIIALAAQTPASVFQLGSYRGASKRLAGLAMDEAELPGGARARATAQSLLALGAAAAGVSALAAWPAWPGVPLADLQREGFAGVMAFSAEDIPAIDAAFGAR
jgi:citrate lyase subunit beta / citryl-CoA lyase